MRDARGKPSRPWSPEHYRHAAYTPETTLPQDDRVFFLLDTVPHVDVSRFSAPDEAETRGAPPFDPGMMVCLLLYAYGVGVFARRNIARACERNLACSAMVGEDQPDLRPLSDFRTLPLAACCAVFVQVLRSAGEAGLVQLGQVSTEGTTRQGTASRHHAMSSGSMNKDVARLREEIAALVPQASQQDAEDEAGLGSRRGDAVPAELARRADRLVTSEAAMQRVAARATVAAAAERQRRAEAEAERQRTDKTRRARTPKAVEETPGDKAPRRCTAPARGIMPTNKKGWDYGGTAHARVDGASQSMVACDGTAEANDKPHAVPMAHLPVADVEPAGMERPKDAAGGIEKMPGT
jgi:transposase